MLKGIVKQGLISVKNIVRVTAFVLVVAVLLEVWAVWFKKKSYDGSLMMQNFYRQPENSIDLLCIGSSHAFIDINTGVLWDEYGIPSYVLGGSLQPFWNTYYNLQEAVKTQTPRLVVLEALACDISTEYSEHGMIINNVSGMHWNMNKLESIRASVCDTDGLIDYTLLFEEFHSRYSELDMIDIASDLGDNVRSENWKGFYDYLRTEFALRPEINEDVEAIPMSNKEEVYYRMIIEFCQEQGIPLLIIVSPDAGYGDISRAHYLYAADIAEEYGVDFIDFNEHYDDIGLDFSYDFGDIGHLNFRGNRKFTSYLGDYITDNFDMIDRSSDQSGLYDSWAENYRYGESRVVNFELAQTTDLHEYIARLNDLSDDYDVFVDLYDISTLDDDLRTYLNLCGIACSRANDERRYLIRGGQAVSLEADENGLYYEYFQGNHHLTVTSEGVVFDNMNLTITEHPGVYITVYDRYNQTVADYSSAAYEEVFRLDY